MGRLTFQCIRNWYNLTLLVSFLSASVAYGQLAASSSSLSFGSVVQGSSNSLQLTVSNVGRSNAILLQATISGSGFTFSGPSLPLTLAPQQTASWLVSFTPQAGGAVTGSLNVSGVSSWGGHNKEHFLGVNITLSGTGTNPTGALSVTPGSMSFGNVNVGSSENQSGTLGASGGSVTLNSASSSNAQFTLGGVTFPVTIAAGQSVPFTVTFAPTAAGGTSANLSFFSGSGSTTSTANGTGVATTGQLSVSPSALTFGNVNVGSSENETGSLSASGGSVTLNSASSSNAQFTLGGVTFPVTIAAGQSVPFTVTFAPTAAGTTSANLSFFSGSGSTASTANGTGVATTGQLSVSPSALSFGNVNVGSSLTQPASLTATGGSVTVSSISASNSQFSVAGVSLPITISAGQTVGFDAVFSPTQAGSFSGTLNFSGNAPSVGESQSGTGVLPQNTVNLSWNGSNQDAGYNVYRGTAPGVYSKINSTLLTGVFYSDNTVSSGTTYYYVTTAVNSSGQESGYSTSVSVTIP